MRSHPTSSVVFAVALWGLSTLASQASMEPGSKSQVLKAQHVQFAPIAAEDSVVIVRFVRGFADASLALPDSSLRLPYAASFWETTDPASWETELRKRTGAVGSEYELRISRVGHPMVVGAEGTQIEPNDLFAVYQLIGSTNMSTETILLRQSDGPGDFRICQHSIFVSAAPGKVRAQ